VESTDPSPTYQAIIAERRGALEARLNSAFPDPTEIVWELGSGHGHFLTAYAQAHPAERCVGIDLIGERVDRALRKKDRARLSNLEFFRAEAGLFLETLPPRIRIRRAFVLFPDPWPKARHHKHRIIRAEFLHALARHAAADCRLYFRTDFVPYFKAGCDVIGRHADWKIIEEAWPFEFETVFQNRADSHHSLVARVHPP
jgi:tRNA (guanine-N7-)-methyltransferase